MASEEHGAHPVALKRIYEAPEADDGARVLVERLWPRGFTKERAHLDVWLKGVAPSRELHNWYGHDPARFDEFRRRYLAELAVDPGRAALAELRAMAARGPVTLVFAARDITRCNGTILRDLLYAAERE